MHLITHTYIQMCANREIISTHVGPNKKKKRKKKQYFNSKLKIKQTIRSYLEPHRASRLGCSCPK